jgi:hypothetical protein
MSEYTNVPLSNFLSADEIKETQRILRTNPDELQVPKLKEYLGERREALVQKGILPSYLAYVLYAKFHGIV